MREDASAVIGAMFESAQSSFSLSSPISVSGTNPWSFGDLMIRRWRCGGVGA